MSAAEDLESEQAINLKSQPSGSQELAVEIPSAKTTGQSQTPTSTSSGSTTEILSTYGERTKKTERCSPLRFC